MRRLSCALILAAAGGCTADSDVVQPPSAEPLAHVATRAKYDVIKLGSLGGPVSRASAVNAREWAAGYADLTPELRHATLWRDSVAVDLEALGGPSRNSAVQWRGLNNRGMVVGISETGITDTLGGTWSCKAFIPSTGATCVGFVWQDGVMTPLPTLGGDNGFASGVNNRGQVVGWAETRVVDPTCDAPQRLQFRAVVWRPKTGRMRQLRPLPGDSTSAATAINDRGQAVGISGECDVAVGRYSALHAVIWDEDGTPTEIPNLGGEAWHTPNAINERGDVVGFSNPRGVTGGALAPYGFLWTRRGGVQPLKPLDGDLTSQARGINARRQVVGVSTGPGGSRAVLWQDGVPRLLQSLVDPAFPDRLVAAQDISDDGVIAGTLIEQQTGATRAFLAIPKRRR